MISGPSSDPENQLLGLPLEIRRKIYMAFLVKDEDVWLDCYRGGRLVSRGGHRALNKYQHGDFRLTSTLSVNKGITAFLRTCRQIESEGTDILYGENQFACCHASVMQNQFVHGMSHQDSKKFRGIGRRNSRKIQKLVVELPYLIVGKGHSSIGGNPFLDFICADLTALRKLTLKIQTRIRPEDADNAIRRTPIRW